MQPRPRLRVGHRPLRRSADSLQLGLAAGEALVLSGLGRGEATLVESLDGRHTLTELYAVAARLDIGRDRVDALLSLLQAEGLLAPADPDRVTLWQAEQPAPRTLGDASERPVAPPRRRAGYVLVGGWGRFRGRLPRPCAMPAWGGSRPGHGRLTMPSSTFGPGPTGRALPTW